uniref:AF-9 ANC1 homology domain-containing protein n=1 Tax=Romanomermis culicivorax TaxID=13658 RepID=A0A915IIM9_ROMCU
MALASSNGFVSSNHGQLSSTSSYINGSDKERLVLKLEVGHESEMLDVGPNPPYGTHTHRWTIFVRGPNETPLESSLIQKVVFQLHEDFPNPRRYPVCKTKVVKTLEFKEPKLELRAKLLKAGAEIVSGKHAKQSTVPPSESFASVFGETICLKPQNDHHSSTLKAKNNVLMKAPSKPAPSSAFDVAKLPSKSTVKNKSSTAVKSEYKTKQSMTSISTSKKSEREQLITSTAYSNSAIKFDKHQQKYNNSASALADRKISDLSVDVKASNSGITQNLINDAIKKEKEDKEKKKKSKKHRETTESVSMDKVVRIGPGEEILFTEVRSVVSPKKEPPAPPYSPLFCVASPSYSPSTSAKDSTADQMDSDNYPSSKTNTNIKQSPPVLTPILTQKSKKRQKLNPPQLSSIDDQYHTAPPPHALALPPAPSTSSDTVSQPQSVLVDSFSSPCVKFKKRPKNRSDSGLDSDYSANSVECKKNSPPIVAATRGNQSPRPANHNGGHCTATKYTTPSSSTSKLRDPTPVGTVKAVADDNTHSSSPIPPDEQHVEKLLNLQRKIMTLDDADSVQRVVDVLSAGISDFWVTTDGNFEFDLFSLDCHVVERLSAIFTNNRNGPVAQNFDR